MELLTGYTAPQVVDTLKSTQFALIQTVRAVDFDQWIGEHGPQGRPNNRRGHHGDSL